ncbi:hypothetical protein COBT_003235, partial [Conglomerata obtusa]
MDHTVFRNRLAHKDSRNVPPTALFASEKTHVLNIPQPMFINEAFLCGNKSHIKRNKKKSKSEQTMLKQSALNCTTFSEIDLPYHRRAKKRKNNDFRNKYIGVIPKTLKKEKLKIDEKSNLEIRKAKIPFDKLNFVPRILYKDNRPYRYLVHRKRNDEKEYDICKSEQAKNFKSFSTDIKAFSNKKSIQKYIFNVDTDVYVLGSKLLAIDALGV